MNELINVTIEQVNDVLVTTSNRVAEELEVNHRDLLEKIDAYLERFQSAELSAGFYIPSNYQDSRNRTYRNYLITEKGVAQLVGGYSGAVPRAFELNVAYINEFERMRESLKSQAPKTLKEALILALEQQERLEALELENQTKSKQIEEMAPKALFADAVSASEGTILIGELAKILKGNGVDIGQNRLFAWLRENGYLIRRKGTDYNAPTQWAMERGLFKVKETAITHSDGHVTINKTTKVTGVGQQYIINKLMEDKIA